MKAEEVVREIYLISKKIDILDKKLNIIDSSLKNVHNMIVRLSDNNSKSPKLGASPRASTVTSLSANDTAVVEKKHKNLVLGSIKLFGSIKDESSNYIPNVKIKIEKDNSIIRESFSDNYGYWEARLPSGEYTIVFSHKDFDGYSRSIRLNNDQREVELK